MIAIATLADHPELVPEVVEIAWREWGALQPEHEHERWLREASATAGCTRRRRPRSWPWTGTAPSASCSCTSSSSTTCATARRGCAGWWCCPSTAAPGRRPAAGGARGFDAGHIVPRLWVFTEHAAAFYERCGWQRHGVGVQDDGPGIVLTRVLS